MVGLIGLSTKNLAGVLESQNNATRVVMPRGQVGQTLAVGTIGGSYLTRSCRVQTRFLHNAPQGPYVTAVFWNGVVKGSLSEITCSTGRFEQCALEFTSGNIPGKFYNPANGNWDLTVYSPGAGEIYYARFAIADHPTLTKWPTDTTAFFRGDCVLAQLTDNFPGWLGPTGSGDILFSNPSALTYTNGTTPLTNGQAFSTGGLTTANGYINTNGSGYALTPVMFIGDWGSQPVASFVIWGTSIDAGAVDTGDTGANAAGGYAIRAMRSLTGTPRYAYTSLASPTTRSAGILLDIAASAAGTPTGYTSDGSYSGPFRLWAMRFGDIMHCGGPINDVSSIGNGGGGYTAAQALAIQQQVWAFGRKTNIKKIIQCTVTISAGSSDHFATLVNQSFNAVYQAGGIRDQTNTLLSGSLGQSNGCDYYSDTLGPSADPDLIHWAVNGVAGYATDSISPYSGIHPTAAIAALQATNTIPNVDSAYLSVTGVPVP